ncbi:hypothetical protein AMECASPLE_019803 [Ameca splendens]|uniref:Uncharacterized protein n=1 Tax=Ameca splendens TaxID=208324 RepID=A0ABV0Y2Z0_9TELE
MGFNQVPAVGLGALHGTAMMAHFKDVGLGRGQAWVALLEGSGAAWTDRKKEKERESPAHSTQQKLPTDPLKGCMSCINEGGLWLEWHVCLWCMQTQTHIYKV